MCTDCFRDPHVSARCTICGEEENTKAKASFAQKRAEWFWCSNFQGFGGAGLYSQARAGVHTSPRTSSQWCFKEAAVFVQIVLGNREKLRVRFVQEIPRFCECGPQLWPAGLSSEPTASGFFCKRQNLLKGFWPRSGLSLTLSRFVGRTGSRGQKSGSDWFFIKTESEPECGPLPWAPNPLG